MISFAEFYVLRMSDFVSPEHIVALDKWQFDGDLWFGEGYKFTEFLRLISAPDKTRSIAVELDEFPAAERVLERLQLPLARAMSQRQIECVAGPPTRRFEWVEDRITFQYNWGAGPMYRMQCVVFHDSGLQYVAVQPADELNVTRWFGR